MVVGLAQTIMWNAYEELVAVVFPDPLPSLPNLSGCKRSQYIKQEEAPGSIEKNLNKYWRRINGVSETHNIFAGGAA